MFYTSWNEFKIEIADETNNAIETAGNSSRYDFIYRHAADEGYSPVSQHGIRVYKKSLYKSALLQASGGATGIYGDMVVIDGNNLVTRCCNKVFSLGVPGLQLNWIKEADPATCFSIYQYHDQYIIHGEICITRLTAKGDLVWQVSGRDIFVHMDNKINCFQMQENGIVLTDWQGFRYKLSYDGQLVDDGINIR